jgi:translation initiation factor 1
MKGRNRAGRDGIVYSTDPGFGLTPEDAEEKPMSPSEQRLRIRLETKHRGGKTVTIVDGFKGTEAGLQELGRNLKNACGTGGSAKDGEIIIQGDHRERIRNWLSQKGYPAK